MVARRGDGAAEDVAEQQHEHDRLHAREEHRLRDTRVADEVALGHRQRVATAQRSRPPGMGAAARRRAREWDCGRRHESRLLLRRFGPCPSELMAASASWASSSSVRWPVMARNTSSRLGSRSASVVGTMPCCLENPERLDDDPRAVVHVDFHRAAVHDRRLVVHRPSVPLRRGAPSSRRAGQGRELSHPCSPSASAGVPVAMTLPWSTTTSWSASRSASSRYWVVRSTVVPSATSPSIISHTSARLAGSSPSWARPETAPAGGRPVTRRRRGAAAFLRSRS